MRKTLSLFAIASVMSLAACNNKSSETVETTETTTADPAITVDPDQAIMETDTTIEHAYPESTPAGTTTGTAKPDTGSGR